MPPLRFRLSRKKNPEEEPSQEIVAEGNKKKEFLKAEEDVKSPPPPPMDKKDAKDQKVKEKEKKPPKGDGQQKKLKPYPYFYLAVAAVFTVLLLVGIIIISRKLASLSQAAASGRGQLIALREREMALTAIVYDLQSLESEITRINRSLPTEEGIVEFVKEFQRNAQDVSVEVFSFGSDEPGIDEANNAHIDFSAEMRGSFSNCQTFLNRLIGLPYLIKLQKVDLSEVDQSESQMVLEARIYVSDPFFTKGD